MGERWAGGELGGRSEEGGCWSEEEVNEVEIDDEQAMVTGSGVVVCRWWM